MLQVYVFTDRRRRITRSRRKQLEIAGSYEKICVPFWRALRNLQGRFSAAELDARWHRQFPWKYIDRLTRAIRKKFHQTERLAGRCVGRSPIRSTGLHHRIMRSLRADGRVPLPSDRRIESSASHRLLQWFGSVRQLHLLSRGKRRDQYLLQGVAHPKLRHVAACMGTKLC
jgi:hypothetical protein